MNDDELSRRFTAQRAQERPQAPGFARMWAQAGRAPEARPSAPWWPRLAFASATVAVVVGAFWLTRETVVPVPPAGAQQWQAQLAALEDAIAAPDFNAWQAPSDFLLTSNSH